MRSRHHRAVVLVALALASSCLLGAGVSDCGSECLYAVVEGKSRVPVGPCPSDDALKLAADPDVQTAIRALGLKPQLLRFKGCKQSPFSAAPESTGGTGRRYVISYPTGIEGSYAAPITHELAHVLQMEVAGGLEALRRKHNSKQIELGADYLTGIVFGQALSHLELKQFQHNLSLIGLYVERSEAAHGTPDQRTAAFRFGVNVKFVEDLKSDFRFASEYFFDNVYGTIMASF
jgi:hypothetical protein